jgi:hypothetical protein
MTSDKVIYASAHDNSRQIVGTVSIIFSGPIATVEYYNNIPTDDRQTYARKITDPPVARTLRPVASSYCSSKEAGARHWIVVSRWRFVQAVAGRTCILPMDLWWKSSPQTNTSIVWQR